MSRIFGSLIIVLLLIISGVVWYEVYKTYTRQEDEGLVVTFLDVGQGDSIFIKTPSKKYVLIDGGSIPKEWSTFDAGRCVVVPYLRRNGIKKIDLVVATHPDIDHIGGLISVLKNVHVDLFLDSGTISTTQTYEDLLKMVERRHIRYRIAEYGLLNIDPNIKFEILSPISDAFINDPNNNSIVIRLEYGKISFLFTGDIGQLAEGMYVNRYGNGLRSTVLKLPHHGSSESSSVPFLNSVMPEVAIISCGRNNPFGHPGKDVLARVEKMGTKIYRTDIDGAICIISDGKSYRIRRQYDR